MRIVLEIESHYPTVCSDCSEEYSVEFKSQEAPALRCFLCFQGSHNCQQLTDRASILPPASDLPSGVVWLCSICKSVNNPIKTKQTKPRTGANNSLPPSMSQTPLNSGLQTPATPDPGADSEINPIADLQSHSLCPEELSRRLTRVEMDQSDKVCDNFKIGKCPHGVSGRTIHNWTNCPNNHPKRCRKYMRFGNDKKKGCNLGA